MNKMIRPVWAEIDLDAIKYNIDSIKRRVDTKELIAVVKADAYGHGALDVSKTLVENGATKLAVAVITEAMELRHGNINTPIMILGYTPLEFAADLINYDIEQTIFDLEYATKLSEIALNLGKKAKVHVALDTGMGRIGFLINDNSLNEILKISSLKGLEVVGIFTHFATADESDKNYSNKQYKKFTDFNEKLVSKGVNIPLKHVSNSGAIIDMPNTYLDGVRAGIVLYGYYPSEDVLKQNLDLKKAITIKTQVAHVKILDKNEYVSYGRKFKTERKSIIATLPIGYADGYSRALTGKAKVIINGKFAPVVGTICMDQCMIDVTDIGDVHVGDEVIVLGKDKDLKFDADDMAKAMGTINYEVLCMIKQRIPRVYIEDGKVKSIRNYI
ncbi:MAG: alanine racemase [Sarcina ventriculi]|uniref:Alanine racemase n=1 Tax=Sarcina ventriculi TaxID=1267 RepID=A0ABP2ALU0_SARVE|nr:alanine racemase [Sarcina ventriculi]MDO4402582.1 alanine racemase [Clostridiaceae bacterium]MBU5321855.1 alanine racemase [Sarcina ventriculi]MCI5635506.1 alanine racemase [Sarcina ventriculi]MDD7372966.1 alanine racemase [Sarcina ventriculi]MDY7063335.1 alanine racemase [Sarcina ventriculi]